MRIVELNGGLIGEVVERLEGGQVPANQVLQGRGREKVFLPQSQFLSGGRRVFGYSTREIVSACVRAALAPSRSP